MKEKEREIMGAVFMERLRIIDMIEEWYPDPESMSQDLSILQTILTEEMLEIGHELGWVKTVGILGKSGYTYVA